MKLVVLNDLHPSELPGAATIAFDFASELSKVIDVEFWHSSSRLFSDTFEGNDYVKCRSIFFNKEASKFSDRLIYKLYREFFSPRHFFWLLKEIFRYKPDLIWVHQIGNRFPRSIFLFLRLINLRCIVTVHDYNYLVPRKLYPNDFSNNLDLSHIQSENQACFKIKMVPSLKSLIYFSRMKANNILLNCTDSVFYISDLQSMIYASNGFRSTKVINNGVDKCNCNMGEKRNDNAVLFVGRVIGKGLDKVIEGVAKNPNLKLILVGGSDLLEIASSKLPTKQFVYLGRLKREALYKILHEVKFTCVLSECFDVFPTITIEAIRHGSIPISTFLAGNSNYVHELNPQLVLNFDSIPDFSKLNRIKLDKIKLRVLNEKLPTLRDSTISYLNALNTFF